MQHILTLLKRVSPLPTTQRVANGQNRSIRAMACICKIFVLKCGKQALNGVSYFRGRTVGPITILAESRLLDNRLLI